ncbi:hypothetical protein SAURM35S_09867 [Streptomyces aurantiogriseus]
MRRLDGQPVPGGDLGDVGTDGLLHLARHSRLDQRGEDLASGAAGVNLVGYITVSSRNPEALARDKRTIRASAGKSYLKLEWCDREHHRAFVNTLPFATGIRR